MLYFITGNKDKFREAKEIIPELKHLYLELDEIQELDAKKIIRHKLEEARKKHSGKFVVEDTAFYIKGMNKLPGVFMKWFEKSMRLEEIVRLKEIYGDKAAASCVVGYFDGKNIKFFEGEIKGKIVMPTRGEGFGFDFIFVPEGYEKTFAELGLNEKNKISHRRIAFEKLKRYLEGNVELSGKCE